MFEQYGLVIGVLLVAGVTALALLIAQQAARNVAQFREEHHQSFTEKEQA